MLLYLILGPFATITHLLFWVLLAVLLRRQGYALWAAVLIGFFNELACLVWVTTGVVNIATRRTWNGKPTAASYDGYGAGTEW